jgi:L-seryl-tRNA(Ser) seleniumtransferase
MTASRRSFFSWTRNALAAIGALGTVRAEAAVSPAGEDYYDKLGVTKIINAAGTYTALTASIMPPMVQAAVANAARHPVRLAELQQKAGEHIANRLKCEAALVTAGAASALTLGTAACMTVGNRQAVSLLPLDVSGLKNEVIIQKAHRYGYDHAIKNCGTRFVEVETLDQYERAFTDRTVMCHFFNAAEEGQITR